MGRYGRHSLRLALGLTPALVLLAALLCGLGAVAGSTRAGASARPGPEPQGAAVLRLRNGTFDPLAGAPSIRSGADEPVYDTGLHLIQFPGPIRDDWYAAIARAGLRVVSYVADYGYLVWGDAGQVQRLAAATPLRWHGPYQPAYALHPALQTAGEGDKDVVVQVYESPDAEKTIETITSAGSLLHPAQSLLGYRDLSLRIAGSRLAWLAALPGVVNVEPLIEPEELDETQDQVIAGHLNPTDTGPSGPGYLAWLASLGFPADPGSYPVIDITDDGIDNGTAAPNHPDFRVLGDPSAASRLVYNANWTTDATADGQTGHGNLNAAIAGGYNALPGAVYRDADGYQYGLGVNPFGRVAGSKIFNNSGKWDQQGSTLALVAGMYRAGSRISTNSWGSQTWGTYTIDDQTYDALVRDALPGFASPGNQQMLFLFAAGNEGTLPYSINSPGNAKNVLTVGATENYRPGWVDGCSVGTADADNVQDIWKKSSRGPTQDGRIKPDVLAPGTHIFGAASQTATYVKNMVCNRNYPPGQSLYAVSSGTSHAVPGVAGAASLLDRYYRDHFGGQAPSPAMIKAYLINSSRYLTGTDAGDSLPSPSQGFGAVNLGLAFDGAPRLVVDQDHTFESSGQVFEIEGVVTDTARPFRVSLAWTDAPGPTIGAAYVNNLDLEVALGNQVYYGNVFSGRYSTAGGEHDPADNAESVFLPAGYQGPFRVRVTAANIAGDGVPGNGDPTDQDFALVVYNGVRQYLHGTVRDPAGLALADASVWATAGRSAYTVTTNASGYYTVAVLPAIYDVHAWSYGHSLANIANVEVVTGTARALQPIISAVPLRNLAGCVTDQTTAGPLAAGITAYGPAGAIVTTTATANASGCYGLALYEAPYHLVVSARLHQTATAELALAGNTTLNIALAALTDQGIVLGHVRDGRTGAVIAGAEVRAQPGGGRTLTDQDGSYELQLPPGPHTFTVTAALHAPVVDTSVVVPQSNLLERDFALPSSQLELAPPEVSVTLNQGAQTVRTVELVNSGTADLGYDFTEYAIGFRSGSTAEQSRSGSHQPRDAFGYEMTDDSSPGGPRFDWLDVTSGTSLGLSDDSEANVSLPFPFRFYTGTFNTLRVGNNGDVLLGSTDGEVSYNNTSLSAALSDNLVVPFWDDLGYKAAGEVYFQVFGAAPFRHAVVEWHNLPEYEPGGGVGEGTFELILYEESGNVKFQYRDVAFGSAAYDYGASATVGIRGIGNNYLQYSYNSPVVRDGMAICYRYPGALPCDAIDIPWLTISPTHGTVAPGHSAVITMSFSAANLTNLGTYTGTVRVYTNDPESQPYRLFSVSLQMLRLEHSVYLPGLKH